MTEEETKELDVQETASEPQEVESVAQEEPRMVPLAALEAERKKRQEEAARRQEAEAKASFYEKYVQESKSPKEADPEDDPHALMEKGYYSQDKQMTKREILEQVYQDVNPQAVQEINKYLKPILEKKPWLANSVDTALNRYARAYEIVQDYRHLVEEKPRFVRSNPASDAQRIVENSMKPRSPVESGKSAQPQGIEFLKGVQGKKEFREYRQKLLRGEA